MWWWCPKPPAEWLRPSGANDEARAHFREAKRRADDSFAEAMAALHARTREADERVKLCEQRERALVMALQAHPGWSSESVIAEAEAFFNYLKDGHVPQDHD